MCHSSAISRLKQRGGPISRGEELCFPRLEFASSSSGSGHNHNFNCIHKSKIIWGYHQNLVVVDDGSMKTWTPTILESSKRTLYQEISLATTPAPTYSFNWRKLVNTFFIKLLHQQYFSSGVNFSFDQPLLILINLAFELRETSLPLTTRVMNECWVCVKQQ